MRYGDNIMTVDYYFAFLTSVHQFYINRSEYLEAIQIED